MVISREADRPAVAPHDIDGLASRKTRAQVCWGASLRWQRFPGLEHFDPDRKRRRPDVILDEFGDRFDVHFLLQRTFSSPRSAKTTSILSFPVESLVLTADRPFNTAPAHPAVFVPRPQRTSGCRTAHSQYAPHVMAQPHAPHRECQTSAKGCRRECVSQPPDALFAPDILARSDGDSSPDPYCSSTERPPPPPFAGFRLLPTDHAPWSRQ